MTLSASASPRGSALALPILRKMPGRGAVRAALRRLLGRFGPR